MPRKLSTSFNQAINREYSFNAMLIVLGIYLFILLPLVGHELVEKIIYLSFYIMMLSISLPFMIRNKRFVLIFMFTLLPVIFLCIEFILPVTWVRLIIDSIMLFYFISLAWIMLTRVFSREINDRNRVQGAIVAYLLIALSFAIIYHLIYLVEGPGSIKGLLSYSRREFVYLSLSTLTTIGYGDITPVSEMARSLANLEALTGQLYPAVLIARLVAMEITSPSSK
jgi:Ion channel